MSTTVAACCCSVWTPDDVSVRRCEEHRHYFRGAVQLTGVGRLIKAVWPVKPDYSAADPATLENARIRGVEVDALFTAYLRGELPKIPAGTREDVKDLLLKLVHWWTDLRGWHSVKTDTQVVLAGATEVGVCDLLITGIIADLKCTYDLEAIYPVQLGGYADLYEEQHGYLPQGLAIIHVTARFKQPRLIELNVEECVRDYRLCRDTYRMGMLRSGK